MTNFNDTTIPPFIGALPEQNDPKYDHIRKALEMYVKVIEAINTADEREPVEFTYNLYQSPEDKKAGKKPETRTTKRDSLVNDRFQRVLHYTNENFYSPDDEVIGKKDPNWERAFDEVKKMFYGVTKDDKPAKGPRFLELAERGADYTQRMWSLPPELLEPTIAICIARDFLGIRKAMFIPGCGIKVRGKTVYPWKTFASRYNRLILDA